MQPESIALWFFLFKTGGMPAYTAVEIKAKLTILDEKIDKAEKEQATTGAGPGAGQHLERGNLRAMYLERERLSKEYERLELMETSVGGKTLARFWRP